MYNMPDADTAPEGARSSGGFLAMQILSLRDIAGFMIVLAYRIVLQKEIFAGIIILQENTGINMDKQYRPGAVGALMDEMERASLDLISILDNLPEENFHIILDENTDDEDCRSVETIMTHVVRSGYGYANSIRRAFGKPVIDQEIKVDDPQTAILKLNDMLEYTVATLEDHWYMSPDDIDKTIVTARSGKKMDLEQILEHALAHILRHRRQIERLLLKKQLIK